MSKKKVLVPSVAAAMDVRIEKIRDKNLLRKILQADYENYLAAGNEVYQCAIGESANSKKIKNKPLKPPKQKSRIYDEV